MSIFGFPIDNIIKKKIRKYSYLELFGPLICSKSSTTGATSDMYLVLILKYMKPDEAAYEMSLDVNVPLKKYKYKKITKKDTTNILGNQ